MTTKERKIVRKAKGSGRWFPGNRKQLESMVAGYMQDVDIPNISSRIVAGIAPHAGFTYSGKVAGHTFRAIKDSADAGKGPDTVVVLGFSHRGGFPGVALMDGNAFETPLGEVQLDKEAGETLAAYSSRLYFNYAPHIGEHSAENEIPFIQTALPGVKLVIGLVGDHDPQTLTDLVDAMKELATKKQILVMASTDMLHHPNYQLVSTTDRATLEKVALMEHAEILKAWDASKQNFCGIGPVVAVMRFAKSQGCKKSTILHYRNSGDDFPESRGDWVVGYSSVIFPVSD